MKKHVQENEKEIKEEVNTGLVTGLVVESELAKLLKLWDELKALGVNSIGDLEVKIARLQ